MGISRFMYGLLYRVGYTPWDGHGVSVGFKSILEALPAGKALDIGCGTGDMTIYLAQKGWDTTGLDFVARAIDKARAKAAAAKANVRYLRGDVTLLASTGAGAGFNLISDSGCMHGLDDDQRTAWAREVTQAAAPGAHLLVVAFLPGKRRGPRGIDQAELERRLDGWKLKETAPEEWVAATGERLHYYHFEKAR